MVGLVEYGGERMNLAFSSDAERRLQELLGRYPNRQAAVIPALHLAVREFGYLSPEAMDLVARRLEVPQSLVLGTATFYTMPHKRPVGRYHSGCMNVACYLKGSDNLANQLKTV